MPIPVICSCTAKLRVGDHLRGQQIQCPQCGSIHAISKKGVVSEGKPADATPPEEEIPDFDDVMEASEFTEAEEDRLDDTLEKGEKLLWAGKPVRFYPIMIGCMIAAGLIFTAAILITVTFLVPNFPSWIGLTGSGLECAVALIVPLFNGWRSAGMPTPLPPGRLVVGYQSLWHPTFPGIRPSGPCPHHCAPDRFEGNRQSHLRQGGTPKGSSSSPHTWLPVHRRVRHRGEAHSRASGGSLHGQALRRTLTINNYPLTITN